MTFRVGQSVVCVDNSPWPAHPDDAPLVKGQIYTILALRLDSVRIVEAYPHQWMNASRFRPIVEHKTDIGFAHEILRKVTKRVDA
jgi:hypothetical protein